MELVSIVDYGIANPAINGTYFPGTPASSSYYWTTTPLNGLTSAPGFAWILNFDLGTPSNSGVSSQLYVRCVR